eukprot:TRINITY_DN2543_c1_g1_i1.p1 TRINITY_DN2543_c1_g1~~TRINITY_DN2543_c1_g1_i1.p1  ORF type:complete len:546 (-),score=180.23 TRINITY_DN2543_c1_g1_i1:125-1762(-)
MKETTILFIICFLFSIISIGYQLEINDAERIIDVSGRNVKHFTTFQISRNGDTSFTLSYHNEPNFLSVRDENGNDLTVKSKQNDRGYFEYDVTLPKRDEVEIETVAVFAKQLTPFPEKIPQGYQQMVLYGENTYICSGYEMGSQKTIISGAAYFQDFSRLEPTMMEEDAVVYGPYYDVGKYSFSELHLHFVTIAPFISVRKLVKEIEVSHWGNVAVEQHFELFHDGAELDGGFSRIDYMHGKIGNSVRELTEVLPQYSTDVYYRDDIGNISSSHVSTYDDNFVKFEFLPRFILFGGWKTIYYEGYNLDASKYIAVNNGKYILDIPYSTQFEEDIVIEELEVRIILPEGVTDVEITTPDNLKEVGKKNRVTYLDTTGREVFIYTASNLVGENNSNIQVSYNLSTLLLFKEPFLLVGGYFAMFLILIVYFRLDFSLHPTVKSKSNIKASKLVSQILNEYQSLSNAFSNTNKPNKNLDLAFTKANKSFTLYSNKLSNFDRAAGITCSNFINEVNELRILFKKKTDPVIIDDKISLLDKTAQVLKDQFN